MSPSVALNAEGQCSPERWPSLIIRQLLAVRDPVNPILDKTLNPSLPSAPAEPRTYSIGDAAAPPAPQLSSVSASKPVKLEDDEANKILKLAQTRFTRIVSWEQKWRESAREELDFQAGEHWTEEQREERRGLPCLTFDRIGPSIDQVVNDARQSPTEPRFIPVGGGADKQTAEILQGLMRNIENDSRADIATETAYSYAVQIGRGWFRVLFEYENDVDFTQKIVIKRIANPFCIYPDPAADEFDYSDMRYCFATEDLDKDVFDELYGDTTAGQATSAWESLGDKIKTEWFPNGAVRVAEYWWVETTKDYICQLPSGDIVPWNMVPEGVIPVNTRMTQKRKVKMAKLCGTGILTEETPDGQKLSGVVEWPGKYIPIIPVIGKEILKDGKRFLRGMIRPAMDGNLMFDYMSSKLAQGVGLGPISQWKVADQAIEGYEGVWAESNRKPTAVLKWHPFTSDGKAIPEPQRISPSVDMSATVQALSVYDNNIKAVLSTYDASLGAPGPEQSGRAINARQREADNAHFDFHDNLSRSMRQLGRVVADLIPAVYSEERLVTVFDPDGKSRQVQINAPTIYKGIQRVFDLKNNALRFDVVATSGPNYATKRAEGVVAITELFKMAPAVFARAIDLLVKMLDIPNGDEIADRVRPADIKPSDEDNPVPPQVQQQLDHAMQLVSALTQSLKFAESKERMERLKLASNERIAIIKSAGAIAAVEAKGMHEQFLSLFEAHMDERLLKLELDAQVANPGEAPSGGPGASATSPQGAPPAQGAPAAPPPAQ